MRTPRTATTIVLLLLAAAMSGCSFSWDSSGIKDVLLGGRPASEIGRSTTNADAPHEAGPAPAESKGDEEEAESSLQKIAILPVAFNDLGGGLACDLCPPSVQMKPTTPLAARLVTGFIYEAIARHPRLLFPTPEVVDKAMASTGTRSLRQTAAKLAADGRADKVVVSALIELRPRVGPNDAPTTSAGVALYVSLVNARTGEVEWSDTFDENESGRGMVLKSYDKLMNDKPVRWSTAEGFSEQAVDELIEDLVGELDSPGWWW